MEQPGSHGHGCPVGCEYCVITKVESRRSLWNERTLLGINKAVTILNPPPDLRNEDAKREFYEFPPELLRGDFVGFNAISDPFWPRFKNELEWFLEKVAPEAKAVTCVTKWSPSVRLLDRLAEIPNFRLIVSITGLDGLERTKTVQRLALLDAAKQRGIKAFPIIHPYIAGMSDLSFLPHLKELGYDEVDVKGLRYSHDTMSSWMPSEGRVLYEGTNESEVLPEDGWREKVENAGIKLSGLKSWYRRDFESLTPHLSREEAEGLVSQILERANVTSSDTDQAVLDEAIKRRM